MCKYLQDTLNDFYICPYCGSNDTFILTDEKYGEIDQLDCDKDYCHCYNCDRDYIVSYDDDSWDNNDGCYTIVEKITDNNGVQLHE